MLIRIPFSTRLGFYRSPITFKDHYGPVHTILKIGINKDKKVKAFFFVDPVSY